MLENKTAKDRITLTKEIVDRFAGVDDFVVRARSLKKWSEFGPSSLVVSALVFPM